MRVSSCGVWCRAHVCAWRACVRVCVRACVRACVCTYVYHSNTTQIPLIPLNGTGVVLWGRVLWPIFECYLNCFLNDILNYILYSLYRLVVLNCILNYR